MTGVVGKAHPQSRLSNSKGETGAAGENEQGSGESECYWVGGLV